MNKIYTVVFNQEELEYILGKLKLKLKYDIIIFNDYPKVNKMPNDIMVLYSDKGDGDITFSTIFELFRPEGDPETPYIDDYEHVQNDLFIKKFIQWEKENHDKNM
jgi:hypothetical protein